MDGIRIGANETRNLRGKFVSRMRYHIPHTAIKHITLFESITGAMARDCVEDNESVAFVVEPGDMGLAIGKGGSNIQRAQRSLGRGVWVIEHSKNQADFVRNIFGPARVKNIKAMDDKTVVVEIKRGERRGMFGRNPKRIAIAKSLVKRHHGVEDIIIKTI